MSYCQALWMVIDQAARFLAFAVDEDDAPADVGDMI